ncbi:5-formyltetrahydrofolate cyclo-ligase [Cohnella sp. WQ 127256]|uniref:5-formyltetrahydrofolate cyclo-ligase n=1 Tax=Cohnella sp. WQ 127256 TaxID=2938790 RepID=UPI002118DD33|nr:5-formyltetrahydrofolate cyclo-ligase [Cohnella sp. WQ 127256]
MDETQENFDKTRWRRQMAAVRDSLSLEDREQRSLKLCSLLEQNMLRIIRNRLNRPLNLCAYAPFRSEASPLPLLEWCWEKGDQIFAPRMLSDKEGMELRKVETLSNWIPGRWGVPEPDPKCTSLLEITQPVDVVLVPGMAFNLQGGRLGYGGGYYDRLYAEIEQTRNDNTQWIGFAYANQVVTERLPMESHDLRLNGLATDEQAIWF